MPSFAYPPQYLSNGSDAGIKPYQGMSPEDIIKQAIEQRRAEDETEAQAQQRDTRAMANKEAGMTLETNQALHPYLMSQISQEANAPQAQPAGQGLPAQQAADDPYSAQAGILQRQKELADFNSNHPVLMAMSPEMAKIQQAKAAGLTEQAAAATGDFGIRQNRDFAALLPQLNATMTPPKGGWNPLSGEKAAALARAQSLVPAYLLSSPAYKEWLTGAAKEQQSTVFNPNMMQGRDLTSLRTRSIGNAKPYMTSRTALEAAEGDYANYLKDPDSANSRVDQQGIIDKYTMVSLGKSPTEAQLELAQKFPGLKNLFDFTTGRIANGQIVPKGIIDEMMRNMRATVINNGQTLKASNAIDQNAAVLGGLDPARVLAFPDANVSADSARYANAPGQQQPQPAAQSGSPVKVSSRAEYDALPRGATYIGPSGHKAVKP